MSCPVCADSASKFVFSLKDRVRLVPGLFTVVECRECGVQYLSPMPDPSAPDPFYERYWEAGSSDAKSLPARAEAVYKRFLNWTELVRLRPWLRRGARVLDVGCGGGDALEFLVRWGYECSGLEASEAGVRTTRARLGIDVRQGTLGSNPFSAGSFDAVVMSHVLEHLSEPHQATAEIKRLLKPSGLAFLMLPSIDCIQRRVLGSAWFVYHPPRHVLYYTPRSLERLLTGDGFLVRAIHHVTLRHAPAILVNSVLPQIEPYHLRDVHGGLGTAARALYLGLCLGVMPLTLLEGLIHKSPTLLVVAQTSTH